MRQSEAERHLRRAIYWANHGRGGEYVSDLEAAGFEITRGRDVTDPQMREPLEYWCWWKGELRGIVHEFALDEAFLFVFSPEAECPRWRRAAWRFAHPFTPLKRFPTPAERAAMVQEFST